MYNIYNTYVTISASINKDRKKFLDLLKLYITFCKQGLSSIIHLAQTPNTAKSPISTNQASALPPGCMGLRRDLSNVRHLKIV